MSEEDAILWRRPNRRYLVTMESVDICEAPPPTGQAAFLEAIVIPSLQALKDWEDGGKIRGVPPAAQGTFT